MISNGVVRSKLYKDQRPVDEVDCAQARRAFVQAWFKLKNPLALHPKDVPASERNGHYHLNRQAGTFQYIGGAKDLAWLEAWWQARQAPKSSQALQPSDVVNCPLQPMGPPPVISTKKPSI